MNPASCIIKLKPTIVIITGLSGSGKTIALRALEDSGFFCVDNLPVALIDLFVSIVSKDRELKKIGIGIDIREKGFLSEIGNVLKTLRNKYRTEILFLEAEKDILLRRFKETRRPHPLGGNIEDAIQIEKERLSLLKEEADRIVDTSSYTPHQLRQFVTSLYRGQKGKKLMTVVLISFGFKFGAPQNIDLLFDVRFLPNPNFVPELKALKGTDKRVSDYVLKKQVTKAFLHKMKELIDFLIPLYIKEGRSYLTIGIGCTGGNHRSPAIVEKLQGYLKKHPIDLSIVHRDIG
ncbi:MAG: RNase adapter RapZ [Nitrospirae bacterium CG_4_10_14_0_8_um_filter_41_23]|nr:MAG: RNase adaptor protein RapZ [Nitrospirae bacterium CG2_30_41_42]PIQ95105.1 MAG: RNase adapter RapZ [Nitrospirae bacterium CG11_big_fil_rev_8_21_14_0_20_41_14]PIV41213.1 MAG: RNase adapter RapZ [Nitrospirae bacterium CG02_land_8_20_14_3_00_41_53]PIW88213.1 MAG: RNase adapter RapZ [Nitrospirae bacterium CG_4_8_14_3_um_filter_41_47]PIY86250.1 MAG: RNase adapter RapZ [Nitrospirae bacterium CG_4_10_14_0_8_um_filter_41_23]PJA78795.1 MAG: RNase adapter RapZ [Nitrospirae bacterium CG_4_9_14_3_u